MYSDRAQKTLEEITGKKPIEIAFYEDTKRMLEEAEEKAKSLSPSEAEAHFISKGEHYKSLAQIDGIREDMKAVSKHLFNRALDYAGRE